LAADLLDSEEENLELAGRSADPDSCLDFDRSLWLVLGSNRFNRSDHSNCGFTNSICYQANICVDLNFLPDDQPSIIDHARAARKLLPMPQPSNAIVEPD
jgi:hypothetical protein